MKVYKLGSHRLICADCRDQYAVNELFGSDRVKLILTDPPYGVGYVEGKSKFGRIKRGGVPIANDDIKSDKEYQKFTEAWLNVVKPHLFLKNSFYIFNCDRRIFSLIDAILNQGFKFAQLLIWVKSNSVIGRMDYMPEHELIAYGWYGTHEFYKSKDKTVIFYPKPNASPLHPTQKPVGLIRRLILNSTKIGDIVYDPFGGSGSTLIACEETARRCLMVEIDEEYCQIIIDRFRKLTESRYKRTKGNGRDFKQ
jgi:DNA modification methylase